MQVPSAKVVAWCQQHIAHCTDQPIMIKIGADVSSSTGFYSPNIIILNPSHAALLEKVVSADDAEVSPRERATINYIAFTLYHEIGHFRHRDGRATTEVIPLIAIPLVIELLSWTLAPILRRPYFRPLTISAALRFFTLQTTLGLCKWFVSKGILALYNQYKEAYI